MSFLTSLDIKKALISLTEMHSCKLLIKMLFHSWRPSGRIRRAGGPSRLLFESVPLSATEAIQLKRYHFSATTKYNKNKNKKKPNNPKTILKMKQTKRDRSHWQMGPSLVFSSPDRTAERRDPWKWSIYFSFSLVKQHTLEADPSAVPPSARGFSHNAGSSSTVMGIPSGKRNYSQSACQACSKAQELVIHSTRRDAG